jgi:hypothetical protein
MIQVLTYVITAAIAIGGLYDFVRDELEQRRAPSVERPKTHKRVTQFVAVVGAALLALLTWLNDRADDRKDAALRARLARIVAVQHEMDRAANAAAQARNGIRSGIEALQSLANTSHHAESRMRTASLLSSVRTDFQRSLDRGMKETRVKTRVELLGYYGLSAEMANEPMSLPLVVEVIRADADLNRVACAFGAFSELTGTNTDLFAGVLKISARLRHLVATKHL